MTTLRTVARELATQKVEEKTKNKEQLRAKLKTSKEAKAEALISFGANQQQEKPLADPYLSEILQSCATELCSLVAAQRAERHAVQQKQYILRDQRLSAFYYTFIHKFIDTWLASQIIHSGLVKNAERTLVDYLPAYIARIIDYITFPGITLLKDIVIEGMKFYSAHEKKLAIYRLANFFGGLTSADQFIEALARQLTLSQEKVIKKLETKKQGFLHQLIQSTKIFKNWLLVNDIDTAAKELAIKQCKLFLNAIMQARIKPEPNINDIFLLLPRIFGRTIPTLLPNYSLAHRKISTANLKKAPAEVKRLEENPTPAYANRLGQDLYFRLQSVKRCTQLVAKKVALIEKQVQSNTEKLKNYVEKEKKLVK